MGAQVCVCSSVCCPSYERRLHRLLQSLVFTMLDLITLISTMGLQKELEEANAERKPDLVLREASQEESNLVAQAADSLSSAFESFESALGSMFQSSPEEPMPIGTAKTV